MENKKIIAINPCLMDDDEKYSALTIGKAYTIIVETDTAIKIVDDQGDYHDFDKITFEQFFVNETTEEALSKELDYLKTKVWMNILNLSEESTSKKIIMQERSIEDDGEIYALVIKEKEFYCTKRKLYFSHNDFCIEDLLHMYSLWQ